MRENEAVYVVADNIFSPLGRTTEENFQQLKAAVSGVAKHDDVNLSEEPVYASLFSDKDILPDPNDQYTFFEKLLIVSINNAIKGIDIQPESTENLLIISSTKGNISLLENSNYTNDLKSRISLHTSAKLVAEYFNFTNAPLVVSNACISGIMAILTGTRLIRSGKYKNIIVAGADMITKFILSGFQSFKAISAKPCRPFDIERDGITLGEGAATMVLSKQKIKESDIKVMGGGVSNDANHISAPSRTGLELSQVIDRALKQAGLKPRELSLISSHGTATIYNDEMEAKAVNLSGLSAVPLNSLKGYYGHTLGAAGLIESVIAIKSLKEGVFIPTLGFSHSGVSVPVNVSTELLYGDYDHCLKTASGFGGCNAAILYSK